MEAFKNVFQVMPCSSCNNVFKTRMELLLFSRGFCKIYINVALFPLKDIFTLLGCFYTQQLSSTPTYLRKRGFRNQGVFPKQQC